MGNVAGAAGPGGVGPGGEGHWAGQRVPCSPSSDPKVLSLHRPALPPPPCWEHPEPVMPDTGLLSFVDPRPAGFLSQRGEKWPARSLGDGCLSRRLLFGVFFCFFAFCFLFFLLFLLSGFPKSF